MSDPNLTDVGGSRTGYVQTPEGQTNQVQWNFGWVNDPVAVVRVVQQQVYPSASATPVGQIGADELPKQVFLWVAYREMFKKNPPPTNQGQVGSCVGFETCNAIRRTMAVDIWQKGEYEEYTDICEEVVYGGSRVEVGNGRLGPQDGSVGAWAAQFVKQWGVLARGKYGQYNLTRYSEQTCRNFGTWGVPDELEPIARQHPVRDITVVNSWPEAKRMLANGSGIAVCSNQGFSLTRDSRGVAAPVGHWGHCMCLDGYIVLDSGEEFGHFTNSWGDKMHTGPVGTWGDPGPDGFWADWSVIRGMLAQRDSWAFAGLDGFFPREIDWDQLF